MGIKILFLYPNLFGTNMIPPAIALFSAMLKEKGHEVEVFDTTYYLVDQGTNSDKAMEDTLAVIPSNLASRGIKMKETLWEDDLQNHINKFKPDLIGISATEDMWELGEKLLENIKDYKIKNNVPLIAGGVFPTFAPELVIKNEVVDIVCVGEGENALLDLCK
jgi:anaerobic magnesium-protoporphyrin IX monomethyl ester cyclase